MEVSVGCHRHLAFFFLIIWLCHRLALLIKGKYIFHHFKTVMESALAFLMISPFGGCIFKQEVLPISIYIASGSVC